MSYGTKSTDSRDDHFDGQSPASSSLHENDPLLLPLESRSEKVASPWHVIIPFFFITFGMGALLAPMLQFYTEIFCKRFYQSSEDTNDGVLTWMMGGSSMADHDLLDSHDCAIPEVQAIVSRVQTIILFLDSASSLLMASFYSSLSDKYGRRTVLRIFGIGGIVIMLCYIAVANFQHIVGVTLLIVAPFARGLLVGDVIVGAVIQSYISDCTTPEERTVAMGRMLASVLAAVVCGPTVASIIIMKTGTVVYVFYLVIVIYIAFYIYATYFIPESLGQQAMETARRNAAQASKQSFWKKINLFSSMSILVKLNPNNASRYTIPILAAIQFLLATLAQPPILLYAMLQFKWSAYESGFLASSMALTRFIIIIWGLPYLLRTMQARYKQHKTGLDNDDGDKEYQRVLFDINMIRSGFGIETVCILLAALATSGPGFAVCLIFQSISVISNPSILSLSTTLVDPSEVGVLCGAQAVLGSIATLTTNTGINFIYSLTVRTMPNLFLYVCAGVSGLACLLSLLIHPVKRQSEHVNP